ncbi:ribosomal-processing cysteine protease Prp [Halanaerobaculum tunisiense]
MIEVKLKRTKEDNIYAFSAQGHAEYAPEGEDIICAAVSVILQTAVFGLQDYLELELTVDTNNGWLSCQIPPSLAQDKEVKAILETMSIGLEETAQAYSDYIKIIKGGGNND